MTGRLIPPARPESVFIALALAAAVLPAQQKDGNNPLPVPSGPFAVGRSTYHWVDSTRPAFVDSTTAARRELMVDVWYPAPRNRAGVGADYLPDLPTLRRAMPDSVLRRRFAPAFEQIATGRLRAHATEKAAVVCGTPGCPLLVFSHGGGIDRSSYAAQLEDLASHGYIVAAIAHTYETHLVVFPDGRMVRAMPAPRDTVSPDGSLPRWRQDLAAERRSQAYWRRVIDVEAADIRFVIGAIARMTNDTDRRTPFARKIDLTRIGAFGHSLGGEA